MKAVFGMVIVACAVVFVSGQASTSSSGSANENSMATLMRNYGLSRGRGLGRSSGGMGGMGGMSSLLGGAGGMGNAALLFGGGLDMNNLLPLMMCTRIMPAIMCMMQYMN